jgi:glucose/arabinose dehydrogenase
MPGAPSRPVLVVVIAVLVAAAVAVGLFLARPDGADPGTEGAPMPPPDESARAGALRLAPVGQGFDEAVGMAQAPGESRLLVIERKGTVRPIGANGRPGPPWLDLSDRVASRGMEQGLLGLAFAPDFTRSGRLYANYTDRSGDTRVVELRTRPGAGRVDVQTLRVVFRQAQPYENHNGGALAFGPDRMLYVALGDGGGAGDPDGRAQDLSSPLGAILRIDPSRRTGGRGYAIPPDNPFRGTPAARPEIWAYGLRNPWRITFDRQTGDLWMGDVGQSAREEVNVIRRGEGGLDFGWNRREGTRDFRGGPRGEREQSPVAEYGHDAGCSITGGYVYRGSVLPDLQGRYLYADWCSGRSWMLDAARPVGAVEITGQLGRNPGLTSFGEDRAGEVYVVTTRAVQRIARAEGER